MSDSAEDVLRVHTKASYRIVVQGCLSSTWEDALNGMQVRYVDCFERAGTTVLEGELGDQAALAGVLSLVYMLGLPLISVEWLGKIQTE